MAETYEIRPLMADDLFPMCTIIAKLGAKELGRCFENPVVMEALSGAGKFDIETVGVSVMADIAATVLSHVEECKYDICRLLSSITGKSVTELTAMSPASFAVLLIKFFRKEEFRDFFMEVSELLKQETSVSSTSSINDTRTL